MLFNKKEFLHSSKISTLDLLAFTHGLLNTSKILFFGGGGLFIS